MNATMREWIFLGVFCFLLFAVPIFMAWATYSKRTPIDVSSLWTHNERIDKLGVILMGTWWAHTCWMILSTLRLTVVTADWLTYTLWATPIIVKMLAPAVQPPSNGGSTRIAGAAPDPSKPASPK
jgi:hypothetical protein